MRLDRGRRVTAEPYQKSGVPASVGLTVAQCETAAWVVLPDGRRWPAAAAISLTLATALDSEVPLWFYALPGVRHLQEHAYRWVAANRSRFPGDTPYCQQHPEECA